jgi:hypothetical protein
VGDVKSQSWRSRRFPTSPHPRPPPAAPSAGPTPAPGPRAGGGAAAAGAPRPLSRPPPAGPMPLGPNRTCRAGAASPRFAPREGAPREGRAARHTSPRRHASTPPGPRLPGSPGLSAASAHHPHHPSTFHTSRRTIHDIKPDRKVVRCAKSTAGADVNDVVDISQANCDRTWGRLAIHITSAPKDARTPVLGVCAGPGRPPAPSAGLRAGSGGMRGLEVKGCADWEWKEARAGSGGMRRLDVGGRGAGSGGCRARAAGAGSGGAARWK